LRGTGGEVRGLQTASDTRLRKEGSDPEVEPPGLPLARAQRAGMSLRTCTRGASLLASPTACRPTSRRPAVPATAARSRPRAP